MYDPYVPRIINKFQARKMDENNPIDKFHMDMSEAVQHTDDVDKLLILWKEHNKEMKFLESRLEAIKNKVKIYLMERKWDNYMDEHTKLSVHYYKDKRKTIDTALLKNILSEDKLEKVIKIITVERMVLMDESQRENLKNRMKKEGVNNGAI